jgi:hypothetical protein
VRWKQQKHSFAASCRPFGAVIASVEPIFKIYLSPPLHTQIKNKKQNKISNAETN